MSDVLNRIGQPIGTLYIKRTSAEITAGVTPVDYRYPEGHVYRYGQNTTPGTTDMSTAIQNAIDVASAAGGGSVIVPAGRYKVSTTLVLDDGVYLIGQAPEGERAVSETNPCIFEAGLGISGALVKTDGTSTVYNCGLIGLKLKGLGSGTPLVGLHFDNVQKGLAKSCSFTSFADQAILLDSDTIACTIEKCTANGCLADTSRAAKAGVLDIAGTDHRILEGEYTASLAALTDSNAYCGAVVIRGGTCFLMNVIGEISDFGISVIGPITGPIEMINCRADLNWGNGYEITSGSVNMTNCLAYRNGKEADNTYDGFVISGTGSVHMANCRAMSITTDSWAHRYGVNDSTGSDSNTSKNHYVGFQSVSHGTKTFNFSAFASPSVVIPRGGEKFITAADTSPSVDNYGCFVTQNASATTITAFDDGVKGQVIQIRAGDANTTIKNNSAILTLTGGDIALSNTDLVVFECNGLNGVWRQLSWSHFAAGAYTTSNVTADRSFDADTVAVAELADVVGTLIADLKLRGIIR